MAIASVPLTATVPVPTDSTERFFVVGAVEGGTRSVSAYADLTATTVALGEGPDLPPVAPPTTAWGLSGR